MMRALPATTSGQKGLVVGRTVGISAFVASLASIAVTSLLWAVVPPAVVEAQEGRIRAEAVTVFGDNNVDRVRLQSGPGFAAAMQVLDSQGTVRVQAATGHPRPDADQGQRLAAAGLSIWSQEGTLIGRLGTPQVGEGIGVFLFDSEERVRIRLRVAGDGTPSIVMLDAEGNVTWSAQ
jgi:hypothetical protein